MTTVASEEPDLPDHDDRDLEAELADPRAGQRGIAVDARCTGCKRCRVKRVPGREDSDDLSSFKTVCHVCRTATWWNVSAIIAIFLIPLFFVGIMGDLVIKWVVGRYNGEISRL